MIVMNSVSRAVGKGKQRRSLFSELSVVAETQQVTALIGRSGFGKSSLLEVAALERRPDSGTVIIQGDKVELDSQTQVAELKASHIGYVPQSPNLCEFMTVRENMELRIQLAGQEPDFYVSRINDLSQKLRMHHLLDSRVSSLSGGERYRASLGRALVTNPSMLICDEPTAALDFSTASDVISIIQDHAKVSGNLSLVATHDHYLISVSDSVIDMEERS